LAALGSALPSVANSAARFFSSRVNFYKYKGSVMNRTRISKAYRGDQHIGWKKTVAGRERFLGYGTSPADEAKAILIASALEAKWQLIKLSGGTELGDTDFDDAKELASGRSHQHMRQTLPTTSRPVIGESIGSVAEPTQTQMTSSSGQVGARRWLHAAIDEFVANVMHYVKAGHEQ